MARLYFFALKIWKYRRKPVSLQRRNNNRYMEKMKFQKYSDAEFKEALIATLNLKKEWMDSVKRREKELGLQ